MVFHTSKVVPDIVDPVNLPLGLTTNEPLQVVVGDSSRLSVDPSVLHLSEVRLAEVHVSSL